MAITDVKAIDIMNYPPQCVRGLVDYNEWGEFRLMARTTFKTMFPTGRYPSAPDFPRDAVEEKVQKDLYGSQFVPYESIEKMILDMDVLGYDIICINATKLWSYRMHFCLIFDFTIDQVNEIVQKAKGRVIGGAGYNPFRIEESLKDVEKAVKEYGFKYVYFHPISFGLSVNDKRCYPLYAKCNELGIPVGMQVGHSAEPLPSGPGNPIHIDEVALDFPNLKINLSHTGWPWIDEWCSMVWKHPNVYGDISAYLPKSLDAHLIRFMNGSRGRNKILFGTNGLGLKTTIEQFKSLDITEQTAKRVLRENALEFLGIG
jgi:predicted TIM-barrel fold metal-dependent hydrolase